MIRCVAILAAATLAGTAAADDAALRAIGFDQQLGAVVDGSLEFTDESGRAVRLDEYFDRDGTPVVLTLGYYDCPMLCPLVFGGLVRTMQRLPFSPDEDYRWLIVSIDPHETAEHADKMKRTLTVRDTHGGAETGWHMLTGTQDNITALADQVGFRFAYDERTQQYAHPAGVIVLTADGRVSKYFFGTDFEADDLRLGLVDASGGAIGTLTDQILLRCYHYDPATGRYGLAVMTAVRIGAVLTLAALTALVVLLLRRERRKRKAATA